MAYPDDKETWERVDTNDIIIKEHKNVISDFLERLQDTLGLGIKLGFDTVKLLLDYLKEKADLVDGKLNKTGGIMTGAFKIRFDGAYMILLSEDNSKKGFFQLNDTCKIMTNLNQVELMVDDTVGGYLVALEAREDATVIRKDLRSETNGKGVILKSPDGSKLRRIYIDNAGNIAVEDA